MHIVHRLAAFALHLHSLGDSRCFLNTKINVDCFYDLLYIFPFGVSLEIVLKISSAIQKKQTQAKKPAFYVCINFAKGTTTVPNNVSKRDHNGP